MIIPIGCCSVIMYFSAIVFREFVPLIVPRIVAKFIPEKIKYGWQFLSKWLSEKFSTSETTPMIPKECLSLNCAEPEEPNETTSFIVKPNENTTHKSIQTYQTPAFLQATVNKDAYDCET